MVELRLQSALHERRAVPGCLHPLSSLSADTQTEIDHVGVSALLTVPIDESHPHSKVPILVDCVREALSQLKLVGIILLAEELS